jgi:biopolymer transport protein ExbD
MSFVFDPASSRTGPRRRPSLTPMIDVVFLLLIFFMLAAQIGRDASLPVAAGGGGEGWSGPPRLVDIAPDRLALNGRPVALDDLPEALGGLVEAPSDTVVLRPVEGADVQRLIDVAEALGAAGFGALAVVE